MRKLFYLILLLAILLRVFFIITDYHEVLWDSGTYIGMGKYIFSSGNAGLWEDIRPVLWPIVLGFGWWLGFDPDLFGRILTLFLSVGCIILLYVLAKKFFSEQTALFSTVIFAFSPLFFYLGFHTYTEIPSLFFLLLSFYFLTNSKYFLSGIFLGISTLARFPMGIFVAPMLLYFWQSKHKTPKLNAVFFLLSFLAALLPFFVFNFVAYGDFFATFKAGSAAIKQVLGCNVLRLQPWSAYLNWIVSEHPLHLFAILGILYVFFAKTRNQYVIVASAFIPFAYYSQLQCRDYRYLLSFLPFVTMLTGYGLCLFVQQMEKTVRRPQLFAVFFVCILLLSLWQGLVFYKGNEVVTRDDAALNYFSFFKGKQVDGELWTSNPVVASFDDHKYEKVYYPIYHKQQYTNFLQYLKNNTPKIGAVLMDNCGGGIICHPEDEMCKKQSEETMDFLSKNFVLAYNKSSGRCWYKIVVRRTDLQSMPLRIFIGIGPQTAPSGADVFYNVCVNLSTASKIREIVEKRLCEFAELSPCALAPFELDADSVAVVQSYKRGYCAPGTCQMEFKKGLCSYSSGKAKI